MPWRFVEFVKWRSVRENIFRIHNKQTVLYDSSTRYIEDSNSLEDNFEFMTKTWNDWDHWIEVVIDSQATERRHRRDMG